MKKIFERTISMSFVLALLCSLTFASAAASESAVMPRYNYIVDTDCSIDINGTVASMEAAVRGNNVDKCQIKMTLQMHDGSSWDDVVSWTSSEESSEFSMAKTRTIDPDESYRVKVTFKVWNGSSTETVTKTATP